MPVHTEENMSAAETLSRFGPDRLSPKCEGCLKVTSGETAGISRHGLGCALGNDTAAPVTAFGP